MTETPGIALTGRRLQEDTMRDLALVSDRSVVRGAGGTSETFTPRLGLQKCKYGRITDREADQYSGLIMNRRAGIIMAPVGTSIPEGSRVQNPVTGTTWSVVADLTSESAYATLARFMLREV